MNKPEPKRALDASIALKGTTRYDVVSGKKVSYGCEY